MLDEDEYRWLEELDSRAAMQWVRDRNAETLRALGEGLQVRAARIREVLDADERLRYPALRGQHLYQFWQDEAHPRGLWRRATWDEYRAADTEWEVLLDVDALAAEEGENWVWSTVEVLRPGYERCLIGLSRGGSDAVVVREFDLRRKAFVADGFMLPEAKSTVSWIDADRIFVATDFGPGSLTASGYPRAVRRWRRGESLSAAQLIFEGPDDDVSVCAWHDPTRGFARDFVRQRVDFYRSNNYMLTDADELVLIDIPQDAGWGVYREWLLIHPRTPWTVNGVTYPAGALLATDFDAFVKGGTEMTILYQPDGRGTVRSWDWTADHLILTGLQDVKSKAEVLTPGSAGWHREPLSHPEGDVCIVDTDPDHSGQFLLATTGFLQPTELHLGHVGDPRETLKREPAFFDTDGMSTDQFFAVSDDGTRVPYFLVGDPGGSGPVLLYGYGGFEVSVMPRYVPIIGREWLARGGRYAIANIRGGGEYGPLWHRAALRENRPRAYEDFAAVARDLVVNGITVPTRLGIRGASNGGLLTGVMLTRYPDLFGAVVIEVPLLDMRRYHRLLAGASWMAEYGDPDNPEDWEYLRRYSPYQNIGKDAYPPTLLVTSTRDDRVHPAHARKMAARLLAAGHDALYFENVEGGHSASANNEQRAFMDALIFEFLWSVLASGGH